MARFENWSSTQGHILTGGGRLEQCFVPGRDFRSPEDLPHYWKTKGLKQCREQYHSWLFRENRRMAATAGAVGAWCRPLFSGGWMTSSEQDTVVRNLQTPSIFIDLRIPKGRPSGSRGWGGAQSFEDLTNAQLRLLSRQHCFAGYTLCESNVAKKQDGSRATGLPVCVRHHAIDWNFHPRFPRSRPNKWYVEPHPSGDGRAFKEWGYASDPRNGQAIYMERWKNLSGPGLRDGPYLVLRRVPRSDQEPDAFLVVVGNHFAYCRDRVGPLASCSYANRGGCASLADAAYTADDRNALIQLVNLEGSYGRVDSWIIEHSTIPWREGARLISAGEVSISKSEIADRPQNCRATVFWGAHDKWEILENTIGHLSGPPRPTHTAQARSTVRPACDTQGIPKGGYPKGDAQRGIPKGGYPKGGTQRGISEGGKGRAKPPGSPENTLDRGTASVGAGGAPFPQRAPLHFCSSDPRGCDLRKGSLR